jgi:putative ABC transport system permease protein
MTPHTPWLAFTGIRRSPRRTLLTVGALANAVCGALLFYGFTRHTYWGLAETFARGGGGHVQLADTRWFDSPSPEEYRQERTELERIRTALEADPALRPLLLAGGIRRHLTGMLTTGDRSSAFLGMGVEPEAEALITPLLQPSLGRSLAESGHRESVVLGEGLAARLGVEPSDWITALVTTDGGLTNAMDLEVAGVVATGSIELDRTWASMPLDTALSLVDSTRADQLVLALHQTVDTDRAVEIARQHQEGGLRIQPEPWYGRAEYYKAVRALYDRIFGIFELLMVLVVVLSLSQAVAAVVAERRQEIALLRVVGLKRRDVVALFVVEGALLGVLGSAVGLGLALVVAWVVKAAGGFPMPPPPGFTVGYPAWFELDALGIAIVLPATIVAAMIASAVPAWRASRGALSRSLAGLGLLIALGLATRGVQAEPLDEARALLADADAARAVPADQRCALDLTIEDLGEIQGWRLLLQGERTLAVSTSRAPGKRQAVLREGGRTWFWTESMRSPLAVGAGQPVQARVAMAELLAPSLVESWAPTGMIRSEDGSRTVHVQAIEGGPAAWPAAELDFGADGALLRARFHATSGKLLREAHFSWEDGRLHSTLIRRPQRPGSETTIRSGEPRCEPGPWPASQQDFLAVAIELAEAG